jgi:hypothetical protein
VDYGPEKLEEAGRILQYNQDSMTVYLMLNQMVIVAKQQMRQDNIIGNGKKQIIIFLLHLL